MNGSHEGRVALITGAARGLGATFTRALAEQGCDVAVADILDLDETVNAVRALGRRVLPIQLDLADEQQVRQAAGAVLAEYGCCDILLNNAAYMPLIPLSELDLGEFRRIQAVNVEASLILAQALSPSMIERGYGRILQIASSTTGTPMPGFLSYVTTKMAGIGLVRALAAELGAHGIRVNALSPGLTATPESRRNLPPELFEKVCQQQLLKQTEEPADLVGAMLYLTSASCGFVTGQTINCDGGVNF